MMLSKKKLHVGLLAMLVLNMSSPLCAQVISFVDTTFSIFVPKAIFGEIDLNTCTDTIVEDELGLQFCYDMLVQSDGEIYAYGPQNGFIYDTILFHSLDSPAAYYHHPQANYFSHELRGLTCDENGFIYSAGKGITKRTVECCNGPAACCTTWPEVYLGTLPPNMECLGDITYRKGKFYLSAIGNKLVEVNMKDPSKSQIVMYFPPGTLPIHGLTTVQLGCDSVVTYAIGRAWNHSIVYEIDFDTWTLNQVCDMPLLAIDGAGNKTECALPPCDLFVDLDHDNSSLAFRGNYCADPFCATPVAVTDSDVVILSLANTLDSLELVLTGVLNTNAEYLETIISTGNLAVLGNGTDHIQFINNGAATLADFEDALKSVMYHNISSSFSFGMRRVLVTGWSQGIKSLVSSAELPFNDVQLETNIVPTLPSCNGWQNGSLLVQAGAGTPPYSFEWQNGYTDSLLTNIGAGSYAVTIEDNRGCVKQDTVILNEPILLQVDIATIGSSIICDAVGHLSASGVGGTMPYSYQWDNGWNTPENQGIGAGEYSVTITDNNGCQATSNYQLFAGEEIISTDSVAICAGETYFWNQIEIENDTNLCLVTQLPNGCDSTYCLTVKVNPVPPIQLEIDGDFCTDTTVQISASPGFDSYIWSNGETGSIITINTAGVYWVEVADVFGCKSQSQTTVAESLTFEYESTPPPCFGDETGKIIIEDVKGGIPPYLYSINEDVFQEENTFVGLASGHYEVSIKDGNDCINNVDVLLPTPDPLYLDIGNDASLLLGESIELTANTNFEISVISWKPDDFLDCITCTTVVAKPFSDIQYNVFATDEHGCMVNDSIKLTLIKVKNIYVPSVFSPNGDGINDVFTFYANSALSSINNFEVFDRWGGKVFSAANILPQSIDIGWDGMIDNQPAVQGTYVYFMKVVWVDGATELIQGETVLIR